MAYKTQGGRKYKSMKDITKLVNTLKNNKTISGARRKEWQDDYDELKKAGLMIDYRKNYDQSANQLKKMNETMKSLKEIDHSLTQDEKNQLAIVTINAEIIYKNEKSTDPGILCESAIKDIQDRIEEIDSFLNDRWRYMGLARDETKSLGKSEPELKTEKITLIQAFLAIQAIQQRIDKFSTESSIEISTLEERNLILDCQKTFEENSTKKAKKYYKYHKDRAGNFGNLSHCLCLFALIISFSNPWLALAFGATGLHMFKKFLEANKEAGNYQKHGEVVHKTAVQLGKTHEFTNKFIK